MFTHWVCSHMWQLLNTSLMKLRCYVIVYLNLSFSFEFSQIAKYFEPECFLWKLFYPIVVVWEKMASKGSDTIRRCDFILVNVALEEVCHCGGGIWGLLCSTYAQCEIPMFTVYFLLSVDQEIELAASSLVPCLPTHCHVLLQWQ